MTEKDCRRIHCCGCQKEISARLTDGKEIYPHRDDLANLPFWRCDTCGNYVGCHHKTDNPTNPLGVIPTPALRQARQQVHQALDPVWKSGRLSRQQTYKRMADLLGLRRYHTANIVTLEEANRALKTVAHLRKNLDAESDAYWQKVKK